MVNESRMSETSPSRSNGAEMFEEEVLACAFGCWYEQFKPVTFKSEVLRVPEAFVQYLNSDGIRVSCSDAASDSSWDDAASPQRARETESDSSDSETVEASFPEFQDQIRAAIERLGGAVLPKLNWSAPKDARWLQTTLKCTSPQDVISLLKASDFVAHDLGHAFEHCNSSRTRPDEFTLVLRRWRELHESNEFRCFVSGGNLFAVSQRQTSVHFEHLSEQTEMDAFKREIRSFFVDHIQGVFPLRRYAFDVYVGSAPQRRVRLVDFSPWGPTTDACLFDWQELTELAADHVGEDVDFRVVRSESETQGKAEKYSQLPLELAQLSAGEGLEELIRKADQFLQTKSNH